MEESKGRVCVTGGTGFIGSWIIKTLLQDGYSVNTTVRNNPEHKKDLSFLTSLPGASQRLQILSADLRNPESFNAVIEGCVGVFHVATPVDFELREPEEVVTKRSIDGALGILKACLNSKTVKRVVYTSSASAVVHGGTEEQQVMDESSWTDVDLLRTSKAFGWSYAVSKTLTEKAVLEFGEQNGLEVVTLIPTFVFGPFICPKLPGSVQASLKFSFVDLIPCLRHQWCMWMMWLEHIYFCWRILIQKGGIIVQNVWLLMKGSLKLFLPNTKNLTKLFESEKIVYSSSPYPAQGGFERGRMVFFEGEKRFELEDLLRASAEMLGKGGFGTAYKAVLDDGNVVAVKRLKDAQITGKREFEQHMEVLGRLRHPNVVSLRAYYFAREEKLLVYDYMPNATLFWLLHGNRGPGRTPLDWTTRLKIAAGAARGVAFIHNSCKSLRLTHGNIKSTNVLLDKQGNAHVSDFGLSVFAGPGPLGGRPNGYRAPEASDGRKQTQKSDVYSFGVLLLEMLTGKCPSVVESAGSAYGGVVDLPRWVQSVVREEWTAEVFDLELMRYKDIEEEMVGLLQIAMTCTAAAPDQRPRMSHVVKMIEELRGVEVSPCHDSTDSVSESPSMSEDACGTSQ